LIEQLTAPFFLEYGRTRASDIRTEAARILTMLASEAAPPELPDPSLAGEDLSAEDKRALTELLVD
jgi:hypothetical protein